MITSLLLLALGLAMDAAAAAIAQGTSGRIEASAALRIAALFGIAHAVAPAIGWGLGMAFSSLIRDIDHWVALVLLSLLGIKMLIGASSRSPALPNAASAWSPVAIAVTTSLDAIAAGITLPALGAPLFLACGTIGLVTAALALGGVYLGMALGSRMGKAAKVAGGLILIGLAVDIFIQHRLEGV